MKQQKMSKNSQIDMFPIKLNRTVDSRHPLVLLAQKIDGST